MHTICRYLDWRARCHAADWGCWWNRDIYGMLQAAASPQTSSSPLVLDTLETHQLGTVFLAVLTKGESAFGRDLATGVAGARSG